jgi:hypothetical protein
MKKQDPEKACTAAAGDGMPVAQQWVLKTTPGIPGSVDEMRNSMPPAAAQLIVAGTAGTKSKRSA